MTESTKLLRKERFKIKLRKVQKKSSDSLAATAFSERSVLPQSHICGINTFEYELYEALRANVPVIDACVLKIVRLVGGFKLIAENERYQEELERFQRTVPVGLSGVSVNEFADIFLDSMITYGKGIGEILVRDNQIIGLYNGDPTLFKVTRGKDPCDRKFWARGGSEDILIENTDRILFACLNPNPKNPFGVSVFRGLPSLAEILMKIYSSIGQNFERAGNVRYAVTYKPKNESDMTYAKDRAVQIAKEWSDGMMSTRNGCVKDFIAVGDVDIKVIGADNQIIDSEVPVRQLLEQMISKLSIPPFLLGLNWSSTERMSTQQCDILTSELEYYRRLLTPVITQIANTYLRSVGADCEAQVEWDTINLLDETELAKARLYNAQAKQLEIQNEREKLNG
ncbi:MAG: phage portal protein [Ruminococcus sp.]|nr:phage portal protein [Ruminococcus sp.]